MATKDHVEKKGTMTQLLWGAGGIYICFIYYGTLQEDVTRFAEDGEAFKFIWFLQVIEAAANVLFSLAILLHQGFVPGIPHDMFALTGFTQVSAKYCTNAAMAAGVSFPVATLAKSGKMIPVMIGSLFLGGASYTLRDYLQVAAIVAGTAMVSVGASSKKRSGDDTTIGLLFLVGSLVCDGLTGGVQKRLKKATESKGVKVKPYDFMFWTNLYMLGVACVFAFLNSEVFAGLAFCTKHPAVLHLIVKFAICSALGQSFVFYTIATFDPLVCTTVTTTRKIVSVLYSVLYKGHSLSLFAWSGLLVATGGILADIAGKAKEMEKKPEPAAAAENAADHESNPRSPEMQVEKPTHPHRAVVS